MENIFSNEGVTHFIERIEHLTPDTKPEWGKMSVSQMLAHCNVAYEMTYENKHPKPGFFAKLMIKLFAKELVVGDKPYTKNMRTSPAFIIDGERDFEEEKTRLIAYLGKTLALGEEHFDGLDNAGFGPLSKKQWNTLFAKHLDHHLSQFGV